MTKSKDGLTFCVEKNMLQQTQLIQSLDSRLVKSLVK